MTSGARTSIPKRGRRKDPEEIRLQNVRWVKLSKRGEPCRTQDNKRPNQAGCFKILQAIVSNLDFHSEFGRQLSEGFEG